MAVEIRLLDDNARCWIEDELHVRLSNIDAHIWRRFDQVPLLSGLLPIVMNIALQDIRTLLQGVFSWRFLFLWAIAVLERLWEWVLFDGSDGCRNSDDRVCRRAGSAALTLELDSCWLLRNEEAGWAWRTIEVSWFSRINGAVESSTRNDRRVITKGDGSCRWFRSMGSSSSLRRGDRCGLVTLLRWSSPLSRMRCGYWRAMQRWSSPKCFPLMSISKTLKWWVTATDCG